MIPLKKIWTRTIENPNKKNIVLEKTISKKKLFIHIVRMDDKKN